MIDRIPLAEVRKRYDRQVEIWPEGDSWHAHLREQYISFVEKYVRTLQFRKNLIVNIGSAGDEYSVLGNPHIHIDLSARLLPRNGLSIVGDAQALPIRNECAGFVMAIGSVINYCSALEFLSEVSRVTMSEAYFLFDFENANAFEHIGRKERGKSAFIAITEYDGQAERIWFYGKSFILAALSSFGFHVVREYPVHILSSFVYGMTKDEPLSSPFSKYDYLVRKASIIRDRASTFIILAQKHS